MKKSILFITLLLFVAAAHAQQDSAQHGTIIVKKKGKKKTLFDQVNDRLILVNEKGKVLQPAATSFDMVMEKDGKMITLTSTSNYLTHEMKDYLYNAQDGTIFYFKNIKVKNEAGESESYPSTVVKADAEFYRNRRTVIIED